MNGGSKSHRYVREACAGQREEGPSPWGDGVVGIEGGGMTRRGGDKEVAQQMRLCRPR